MSGGQHVPTTDRPPSRQRVTARRRRDRRRRRRRRSAGCIYVVVILLRRGKCSVGSIARTPVKSTSVVHSPRRVSFVRVLGVVGRVAVRCLVVVFARRNRRFIFPFVISDRLCSVFRARVRVPFRAESKFLLFFFS